MSLTPEHLVDAWIALRYLEKESPDTNYLSSPPDSYLGDGKIDEAFDFILAVLKKDPSWFMLDNLSAGPMKHLLRNHGDEVIERVEAQARRDPVFAKLLGGVWKDRMTDDVWNRIVAVRDEKGWDEYNK